MSELTTTQKVKDYLGISSATNDTVITELVKNISSQIEIFCNRSFGSTTYTQVFDVECGDSKIFLKSYPIITLNSVKYRAGSWGNPVYVSFNENDYLENPEEGKISFAMKFPDLERYIEVNYVGGYLINFSNQDDITQHTLPRDLTQIATEMVGQTFQTRKSQGILSESTEGQSITYNTGNSRDLTKSGDFRDRLNRYRNFNI